MTDDWPVELRGVTESVVATEAPSGRYSVAALGVHAPGDGRATARTYGRTRTRRNLERTGEAVVQFHRDPVLFVDAALGHRETEEPVLPGTDAWARVRAERRDAWHEGETPVVEWALAVEDAAVERRTVTTINRGHGAVVEATVAASRLGVAGYDADRLRDRIEHLLDVAERCGGPRERAAVERLIEQAGLDR